MDYRVKPSYLISQTYLFIDGVMIFPNNKYHKVDTLG